MPPSDVPCALMVLPLLLAAALAEAILGDRTYR